MKKALLKWAKENPEAVGGLSGEPLDEVISAHVKETGRFHSLYIYGVLFAFLMAGEKFSVYDYLVDLTGLPEFVVYFALWMSVIPLVLFPIERRLRNQFAQKARDAAKGLHKPGAEADMHSLEN